MKSLCTLLGIVSLTVATGCGTATDSAVVQATAVSVDGSKYLLNEEPDGAVGVIAARETAEDGKPLIMVGRIGGLKNPWVDGRAAFTLLDASMEVVTEGEEMTDGAICTNDCCNDKRMTCTALVKIVDPKGSLISVDTRKLLGVKEADMIVVQGRAQKDGKGNFVMLAERVYIRE